MSVYADEMLMRGITAARTGEKEQARKYLERSLELDPDSRQQAEAWLWLAEVSADAAEQRNCLENSLAIDPFNPRARRKLAILDGKLDPAAVIDPDRAAQPAPPPDADPRRFICPNCGGRMTYTPDGQSLVCESCASRERLKAHHPDQAGPASQDFFIAMATAAGHAAPEAVRTLTCQGCGANFLLPPQMLSLDCPYCQSAYVVANVENRELLAPGALIPFKIERTRALQILDELGVDFRGGPARLSGLYLPVWSFDLGGRVTWSCRRYQNRRWVADSGEDYALEHDVLVAAGERLKALYPQVVSGFDLSDLAGYDPRFLADWPAETYQIPLGDASLEARQATITHLRDKIAGSLSGEVKDLVIRTPELAVDSFKLVLLPFWVAAPGPGDERPVLWLNGQNGKPIDPPGSRGLTGWLTRLLGGDR